MKPGLYRPAALQKETMDCTTIVMCLSSSLLGLLWWHKGCMA